MGQPSDEARASARTTCENNYGFCRVGMTFCADGVQPRRRRDEGRAPRQAAWRQSVSAGLARAVAPPGTRMANAARRRLDWISEKYPDVLRDTRPLWDERSPLAREGQAAARCGMNASAGR